MLDKLRFSLPMIWFGRFGRCIVHGALGMLECVEVLLETFANVASWRRLLLVVVTIRFHDTKSTTNAVDESKNSEMFSGQSSNYQFLSHKRILIAQNWYIYFVPEIRMYNMVHVLLEQARRANLQHQLFFTTTSSFSQQQVTLVHHFPKNELSFTTTSNVSQQQVTFDKHHASVPWTR